MKILYALLLTSILLPALAFSADDPMISLFNFQSKMVKLGSVAAMMKLGKMYEQGQGTNQDWDKALDMYQQAESESYPGAKDSIQRVKQKKKQGRSAIKINEAEEKMLKEAVKVNKRLAQKKARLEKEASARKQQAAKNRLIQEQAAKQREELRIAEQKKLKKKEVKAQITAEEISGYDEGDEEEDKTAQMKKLKKKEVKAQTTAEEISGYDEGDEE